VQCVANQLRYFLQRDGAVLDMVLQIFLRFTSWLRNCQKAVVPQYPQTLRTWLTNISRGWPLPAQPRLSDHL